LTRGAFSCFFTAFCITSSVAAPISLHDDLDRPVELQAPARRIVTLAPFLTELVYAAGAGERVVGVSAYSDFPLEARKLPQVSSAAGVSVEQVAALKPDLVLAWRDGVRPEDVERIARLGAAVFVAQARTLADVPRLLHAVGRLAGVDVAPVAAGYERSLERIRREYAGKPKLAVFLEIWHRPLTTISGRHFMNEALEICGARNVFKDLDGVAPLVSWEQVYERDPEAVVGAGSAANAEEFAANWRSRDTLAAVKAKRLVFVEADTIQRPTTRTPDGIAHLCERLDGARNR